MNKLRKLQEPYIKYAKALESVEKKKPDVHRVYFGDNGGYVAVNEDKDVTICSGCGWFYISVDSLRELTKVLTDLFKDDTTSMEGSV